ncbi:MAG: TetR/AcrR family transcriptional regulator [Antricoccus sp.]
MTPRERLLGKVIAHYAKHGVRDTSLRTLATAIGTSQRMLSYHFGSREDLLTAVMHSVAIRQAAMIGNLFKETTDPFEAGWRNWEATVSTAQIFGPLYFELASHAMAGRPYADDLGRVVVDEHLDAFARAYESVTSRPHARVLARLTLAVGQGVLFNFLIDNDREAADAAIHTFTAMMRAQLNQSVPSPPSQQESPPQQESRQE